MAGKSRFVIAETRIRTFFKQNPKKVFTKLQLIGVLEEQRATWNIAPSTTDDKLIDQLVAKEVLRKTELHSDGYLPSKELYVQDESSVLQIATVLAPKAYMSHYSAIWMNGLTTQIPKIIYVTFEQTKKPQRDISLTQAGIDAAFAKPQRRSSASVRYGDFTFMVLNGGFTNRLGVHQLDGIPVTNVERTLLDSTVRPGYAGGVSAILEAYRNARGKLSLNKLVATLDALDFIYPYFQAVGFYLERAGYQGKKLDELRERPKAFDFYLTYDIEEKDYSADWRLYFPKGL